MKRLSTNLIILSMLALSSQSLCAAEDDGERGTSVYDKHPECMERTDGTAANPKCTPHDGPPHRKVIGDRIPAATTKGSNQGTAQTPGSNADAQGSESGR